MNIPILYVALVIITVLATGRGILEAVFDGSAKRLSLTAAIAVLMMFSWTILVVASDKEAPDDRLLYLIAIIGVIVAFIGAIASTMAMIWMIVANRKSLPGKG